MGSEEELRKGYVLCPAAEPLRPISKFKAQIQILELPEGRAVLTAGYKAVIHVHLPLKNVRSSSCMRVQTRKQKNNKSIQLLFGKVWLLCAPLGSQEPQRWMPFSGAQQLGRFTLRDEGRTIAIGVIKELEKEK